MKVADCDVHDNLDGIAVQTFSANFQLPFVDNEKIKLEENRVYDNTRFGMLVGEVQGSKFRENRIHDNGADGFRLLNESRGNEIEENIVKNNGGDGIALRSPGLQSGPTDNEIEENVCKGNGGFDCLHDVYSTPNDWEDNECGTSSGDDIAAGDDDDDDD